MNPRTSPVTLAVTFTLMLTAGCGSNADSPGETAAAGRGSAAAALPAPESDSRAGTHQAAEPAADQFGLQRFTIVTKTYRAPVKVGLRTRRESSETLTWHVENHGERVALETRSDHRHEQYFWDGERGILRDVIDGKTADQGGVRLKRSQPDERAVAPVAQLESWGYERSGEKTVLGRQCERWASRELRTEFCRWRRLVLESREFDADGNETGSMTTVEIREGEGIPAAFASLKDRL